MHPEPLQHAGSGRPNIDRVLQGIADRAVPVDQGKADLSGDIAALMHSGLLSRLTAACLPGGDTAAAVRLLRALGRANLSVGRLAEGHVNALLLIHLYGNDLQKRTASTGGRLHGVWGADGDPPVKIRHKDGQTLQLSGQKRFCSGLGLVQRAVVTAKLNDAPPVLMLIDASDPARANAADWRVSGMRATGSGSFAMDDLQGDQLGQPGDYMQEPHFDGGIWRYLAVHAGGLEALAQETRAVLATRPMQPLQMARLVDLAIAAQTARMWAEAAAQTATAKAAGPDVVPQILLARQAVEAACQQGITLAERAVGTAAFAIDQRVDLIRRDLGMFLRQADLDGKTLRAGQALVDHGIDVGEPM